MSLEPENVELPETAPVPGGHITRRPGETEEEFGRRADALRLAARRGTDRPEMTVREHMARCFDVPLSRQRS